LARGGLGRGAGGVVGVLGTAVGGELGVGVEGLGPELRGGGVSFRVVGALGQGEALGVVLGGLAVPDGTQAGVEGLKARVAGLELVQFVLGLGGLVVAAQAPGGLDQVRQVVAQELPVGRVSGVRGQGLLLPCNRFLEVLAGLVEVLLVQVDQRQ